MSDWFDIEAVGRTWQAKEISKRAFLVQTVCEECSLGRHRHNLGLLVTNRKALETSIGEAFLSEQESR